MLNAEKYKDAILKQVDEYGSFSATNNNRIRPCNVHRCDECCFSRDKACDKGRLNWLLKEYTDPIKLTQFGYDILKKLKLEWVYIARDKNNDVYVFSDSEPYKITTIWYTRGTKKCLSNLFTTAIFPFIKWEDKKPYKINDILNNHEVLDDE